MILLTFERSMNLVHALPEEEQTAGEKNQIAPRNIAAPEREKRFGEPHHPGDRKQQHNARSRREPQAQCARTGALRFGQPPDEDRNEYDVVYPEDDLQRCERCKRDPRLRVGQSFHVGTSGLALSNRCSDATSH